MPLLGSRILLVSCLLGLLLVPLPGGAARADDAPPAPPATWSFDVRVAKVLADPVSGLTPAPWEAQGPVVPGTWTDHLRALSARGSLTLLMDQQVSGTAGGSVEASNRTMVPIHRFDNRTKQNETWRFDRIERGVAVDLRPGPTLTYDIGVRWLHWLPKQDAAPTAYTRWRGSYAGLGDGQTLAFVARAHIRDEQGLPKLAEIHCFLTAHRH